MRTYSVMTVNAAGKHVSTLYRAVPNKTLAEIVVEYFDKNERVVHMLPVPDPHGGSA